MLDFISPDEFTHMPFVNYDRLGRPVFFFCRQVAGFWKIFYCLDGANVERLQTGLPDDATECSPVAEWEDGRWKVSFVAGGAEVDRAFYLYFMSGLDAVPVKTEKADFGFVWEPRTACGLRSNEFTIRENGRETRFIIPTAEFIYRLAYVPEDPNQLLITGQNLDGDIFSWIFNLHTNELHAVIADGLPAYKCCFFKGRCFYASRGEQDGFEERHITEGEEVQYMRLDSANIVIQEVEQTKMACGDCLRKHLAAAMSYGKEVMNGHGAGGSPDHRCDVEGELVNAEHHAEAMNEELAERIRALRKTLEKQLFQPAPEDIDEIREIWNATFALSGCNCRG